MAEQDIDTQWIRSADSTMEGPPAITFGRRRLPAYLIDDFLSLVVSCRGSRPRVATWHIPMILKIFVQSPARMESWCRIPIALRIRSTGMCSRGTSAGSLARMMHDRY